MKTALFYKWSADGKPIYGEGAYDWSGAWQPRIEGELVPCDIGFHVLTAFQLPFWCGTQLDLVEADLADAIDDYDTTVVRTWRHVRRLMWDEKRMVEYAQACVERVKKSDAYAGTATYAQACAALFGSAGIAALAARAATDAATVASYAAASAGAERDWQRRWIEKAIGEPLMEGEKT